MPSSGRRVLAGGALSSLLHLALAWFVATTPPKPVSARPLLGPGGSSGYDVVVSFAAGGPLETHARAKTLNGKVVVRPGGPRSAQNIDAATRGTGGARQGARAGVLLMHQADALTLQDSPLNAPRAEQTQRIRTAPSRASLENRRATPNAQDQPFLASGAGEHPERRPWSSGQARRGARQAFPASVESREVSARSALATSPSNPDFALASAPPRAPAPSAEPSPGVGALGPDGVRPQAATLIATGRPPVDPGPAATPARNDAPPVRDDRDSELLAARLVQSQVRATRRRGPEVGVGPGGVGGGGPPGVRAREAEGGRAAPFHPGPGTHSALDVSDPRYLRWHLVLRRRVHERLAFPRARMLAMDQGYSVFRFRVRPDGSLAAEPRLVRSSGFEDFDAAARSAIRGAAPFAPLPEALVGEETPHHAVSLRVEHWNPLVR